MSWPMSRHQIRLALTRSGITPLRKPHDILMIDGSAAYDYCRFLVPLSHLACERLPMLIDRRTGRFVNDETRLSQAIGLAFLEPISDMTIQREHMRWLATFTIYIASDRGRAAYKHRAAHMMTSWAAWADAHR